MTAVLAVLIPLGAVALVLLLIAVVGKRGGDSTEAAWKAVAAELGLSWSRASNLELDTRIEGTLDGFPVLIHLERLRDATRPSRHWTQTRVRTSLGVDLGVGLGVASYKAGGGWVLKAAAQPKLRLDAPDFERRFAAHARDSARAAPLLGAAAQQALIAADDALPGIYLDDTAIGTELSGVERDRAKLVAIARAQVALAKALRQAWKN